MKTYVLLKLFKTGAPVVHSLLRTGTGRAIKTIEAPPTMIMLFPSDLSSIQLFKKQKQKSRILPLHTRAAELGADSAERLWSNLNCILKQQPNECSCGRCPVGREVFYETWCQTCPKLKYMSFFVFYSVQGKFSARPLLYIFSME
jgi:hypothetical protein